MSNTCGKCRQYIPPTGHALKIEEKRENQQQEIYDLTSQMRFNGLEEDQSEYIGNILDDFLSSTRRYAKKNILKDIEKLIIEEKRISLNKTKKLSEILKDIKKTFLKRSFLMKMELLLILHQ